MTPSEIRRELLEQHREVRARMDDARGAITRWKGGSPARDAVQVALALLADAVRKHNRREEELLRDIIPTVDAWGPARAEIMVEEHAKEHAELHAALIEAGSAPDSEKASAILDALVTNLGEHMTREEKILLSEDVLHDDQLVRDYFGG